VTGAPYVGTVGAYPRAEVTAMQIRALTEAEVEFTLEIEDDDSEFNFESDEPEKDEELRKELRSRLHNGDLWAWCTVKVTAKWKDWKGVDYLGGCSYKDEADFRQDDGYFGDMKERALEDLNKSLAKCAADLAELTADGVNVQPLADQFANQTKELAKS
jgi:hypothetical protein